MQRGCSRQAQLAQTQQINNMRSTGQRIGSIPFVNVQGILMPSRLCCESGMVDKCGACDSDGTSCPSISTVHFKPRTHVPADRRSISAGTHLYARFSFHKL
jgi:hypothetical protein